MDITVCLEKCWTDSCFLFYASGAYHNVSLSLLVYEILHWRRLHFYVYSSALDYNQGIVLIIWVCQMIHVNSHLYILHWNYLGQSPVCLLNLTTKQQQQQQNESKYKPENCHNLLLHSCKLLCLWTGIHLDRRISKLTGNTKVNQHCC